MAIWFKLVFMAVEAVYSISDLAGEFGVTTRTIRFYEEKGLLSPERRGMHRVYSPRDRVRLELILRGKRVGLTLEESREIIDMYKPGGNNARQYHALLDKVDEKQAALERQMDDIRELMEGLQEIRKRCETALGELNGTTFSSRSKT